MDIQVDPNLVNQAYRGMLADANGQVALLQAAATQVQNELAQALAEKQSLENQVQELNEINTRLMETTGRQDGVPQEAPAAAE